MLLTGSLQKGVRGCVDWRPADRSRGAVTPSRSAVSFCIYSRLKITRLLSERVCLHSWMNGGELSCWWMMESFCFICCNLGSIFLLGNLSQWWKVACIDLMSVCITVNTHNKFVHPEACAVWTHLYSTCVDNWHSCNCVLPLWRNHLKAFTDNTRVNY